MLKSSGSNMAKKTTSAAIAAMKPGHTTHIARCSACRPMVVSAPSAPSGRRGSRAQRERCRPMIDDRYGEFPRLGRERHDPPPARYVAEQADELVAAITRKQQRTRRRFTR